MRVGDQVRINWGLGVWRTIIVIVVRGPTAEEVT